MQIGPNHLERETIADRPRRRHASELEGIQWGCRLRRSDGPVAGARENDRDCEQTHTARGKPAKTCNGVLADHGVRIIIASAARCFHLVAYDRSATMRMSAILVILFILFMAVGCGDVSTVTPAQSDSLILQLDAPAEASAGTAIPLKLTLRNSGKQPVSVMLGGRPPSDFVVIAPDGAEVWRWSTDQVIQAILEMKALQPGEQLDTPRSGPRGTIAAPWVHQGVTW